MFCIYPIAMNYCDEPFVIARKGVKFGPSANPFDLQPLYLLPIKATHQEQTF